MARYTCSYRVKVSSDRLQPILCDILEDCSFELTYQAIDYMMAREIPGETPFTKLVIVDVFIDNVTTRREDEVQVSLVVKNDELPLRIQNHCRTRFDVIQQAIAENQQWHLIENVAN